MRAVPRLGMPLLLVCSAGCGASVAAPATVEEPRPLLVTLERLGVASTEEPALDPAIETEARESVAARVRQRKAQSHGALPPVNREEAATPDSWPGVIVQNDTPHGLVVWFSGACPRTIALAPGAHFDGEVCEGTYDIAAELSSDDYLPFVGEENELEPGYSYSLTFYVVAAPSNPGHPPTEVNHSAKHARTNRVAGIGDRECRRLRWPRAQLVTTRSKLSGETLSASKHHQARSPRVRFGAWPIKSTSPNGSARRQPHDGEARHVATSTRLSLERIRFLWPVVRSSIEATRLRCRSNGKDTPCTFRRTTIPPARIHYLLSSTGARRTAICFSVSFSETT